MEGIGSQMDTGAAVARVPFVVTGKTTVEAKRPARQPAQGISTELRGGEIEEIVRREIPAGSTVSFAEEFLRAAGFTCEHLPGEKTYFGAIRELNPAGDGVLRATLTNRESHWPSKWICIVDIHIVREQVAGCRAVAFTTR